MSFVRAVLKAIQKNRRLQEDVDFMSQAQAATRLQARFSASLLLLAVAAMSISFIAWASWAEVEQVTRGFGQVVPRQDTQIVQSLEGGILSELLVHEGDKVTKGQTLARISNVAFASDKTGIQSRTAALQIKRARLQAEVDGTAFMPDPALAALNPSLAANEAALYTSRQQDVQNALAVLDDKIRQSEGGLREVEAQVARLNETRALLQKEVDMTRRMVEQKAAPEMQAIRLERELADIRGNLNASGQRRSSLQAELSAARKERTERQNNIKSTALTEISEVEAELSGLQEALKTASDRVDRSELKSPVDGVIKVIHMETVGGVVEPAMRLMEIVPSDKDLMVTAKVAPADIAFLKIGQPVKVKITAYDAQRFGTLEGTLARISADTVADNKGNVFFEIDVVTAKNYLGTAEKPLPIIPGMQAQVDVITGMRTIMSYLLKPLLRARQEALTER